MDDLDLNELDRDDGPSIDDLEQQWQQDNPPSRSNEPAPTAEEWRASQRQPAAGDDGVEEQPQATAQPQYQPDLVPRENFNGVLAELQRVRAEKAALQQQQEAYLRAIAEKTGAIEQPQAQPEDDDPVRLITGQLAEIRTRLEQKDFAEQQARHAQHIRATLDADLQQARQQAPDFDDAFNHVRGQLVQSLQMQGIRDPQQIKQAVVSWDAQFVQRCIAEGRSPAQALYAFAWQNGFQGRPQQAPPAAPNRMQVLQQRHEAAAGVPGGGRAGSVPNGIPRNAKQLAQLGEEQYAALLDGMGDDKADQYLYDLLAGGS